MKLVHKPGRILTRSAAMWCVYIAGLLQIAPDIVPFLADYIPRWASLAALLLSPLGRVIEQRSISGGSNGE